MCVSMCVCMASHPWGRGVISDAVLYILGPTMSELFMECEEEELEPWQRAIPEISLIDDDDDDEPIFVGEICSSKLTPNIRTGMGIHTEFILNFRLHFFLQ